MLDHLQTIRSAYGSAKRACAAAWISDASGEALRELAILSLKFLINECSPVELTSLVPGKQYFSYARKDAPDLVSRPANSSLFVPDPDLVSAGWEAWLSGEADLAYLGRICYTLGLAPCLAMELFDRQNKKGPATYFECFVGHMFARAFGTNPTKRATLSVQKRAIRMTMDFLFDVPGRGKVHLPVKMSTRERVVQAWAHQRLLSSAYGEDSYKGIMVLFSETKLDSRSREVVEICVPDQWLAYQALLSKMERIYYFDRPERYQTLTNQFPDLIVIKDFAEFFTEKESVLPLGS